MVYSSSPPVYPPTSSPPIESPRKRRKLEHATRKPLNDISNEAPKTRQIGGFILDDNSDDEEDLAAFAEAKKRFFSQSRAEPEEIELLEQGKDATREKTPYETPPASSPIHVAEPVSSIDLQKSSLLNAKTCSGKRVLIEKKPQSSAVHYERIVAARSKQESRLAQQSYYGIDIHSLISTAEAEEKLKAAARKEQEAEPAIPLPQPGPTDHKSKHVKQTPTLLWTEKYRARKFTDLVGDERTHRAILHWFKAWDDIVFPHARKSKLLQKHRPEDPNEPERAQRKVLLLSGPPGLGKTTVAHVCARQAGYEVQEINASDERSRDVVHGRIRDMLGTENVRAVRGPTQGARGGAKPLCVIVDEVDGVVGGNSASGGEGGFIKALLDLLALDERNSKRTPSTMGAPRAGKRKDTFRMLRPIVLICNDLYHPALKPLRSAACVEVLHVRKPPLSMVVPRMQAIFAAEGVPADADGVRHLCEAAWGVSTRKEDRGRSAGVCEGDIRGVLVLGEWVAARLRNQTDATAADLDGAPSRLSKRWIETNLLHNLAHGGSAARSLARGGTRDVVDRVFLHNAGFAAPAPAKDLPQGNHVAEAGKHAAMARLLDMVASSGDDDRIMTDIFTQYPTQSYQDDTLLSKPAQAYDWLHFHSALQRRVSIEQEWELAAYLGYPVLAFHNLFAGSTMSRPAAEPTSSGPDQPAPDPFSGPRASFAAFEAQRSTTATLLAAHGALSASLQRSFRSPAALATELVPALLRMLSPVVKPVVVGGSGGGGAAIASVRRGAERALVRRAVNAMVAAGVRFERARVEFAADEQNAAGWVMRMEPSLDEAGAFATLKQGRGAAADKVRFAVRQVLEQEWRLETARLDKEARWKRAGGEVVQEDGKEDGGFQEKVARSTVKRDFFGRVIVEKEVVPGEQRKVRDEGTGRIWVTYHEGFSNAVRKPITLKELLEGL